MTPAAILHGISVGTFVPMLHALAGLLGKARGHAREKGTDLSTLVTARLAPDMYTLAQQVNLACFHARDTTANLTGTTPPPPGVEPDATFDAMEARIAASIAELEAVSPAAFEGSEARVIEKPLGTTGMTLACNGFDFLRDWGIPHFYFHVVTAYDILRHHGVVLGKPDFVPHVGRHVRGRPGAG